MPGRSGIFRLRDSLNAIPSPSTRIQEVAGPLPWFNPTNTRYQNEQTDQLEEQTKPDKSNSQDPSDDYSVSYYWSSRYNRKGRHEIIISSSKPAEEYGFPRETYSKPYRVYRNIIRMFTSFPCWDISYVDAVLFTIGSFVFVIAGIATYLALYGSYGGFTSQSPVIAFVGTNIFLITNILLMLETINDYPGQCLGWSTSASNKNPEGKNPIQLQPNDCQHHHSKKGKLSDFLRSWRWLPSYSELRYHYARDLGFLGTLAQLFAAAIFYFGSITRLPWIYMRLTTPQGYALIWTPKILGSLGFTFAGYIFMVETQKTWLMPKPDTIGWHIGFLSMLGGIGFFLSTVFGLLSAPWAEYQSAVAMVWASVAFLIAGFFQWYESLDKYCVRFEQKSD